MMGTLHKFRQWIEILLVAVIAALVIYIVYFKPPSFIKIPGTNTIINMKEATQDIKDKLKGIDELNKKVDDLTQKIKELQTHSSQEISEAGKETDARKSMDRMKEAW